MTGGLIITGLAFAAPAANASGPGSCVSGDACIFYHQKGGGGGYYGAPYVMNYGTIVFGGCSGNNCDGDGQLVRNNAASVSNHDPVCTVDIHEYELDVTDNPGHDFGPGTNTNFPSWLRNNEASQNWVC